MTAITTTSLLLSSCILLSSLASANVAYPGIWTARQPDGESTNTEQLLVGTPDYHFAVVETDTSFYPTLRNEEGTLVYATKGVDGRYLATNQKVGAVDPDNNPYLQTAVMEGKHVIHAQCMERDYCRWKKSKPQTTTPLSSVTGTWLNIVIPVRFADHTEREVTPISDLNQYLFHGDTLSVQHYFKQQSYQKFTLQSEITPWVTIPYTEAECAQKMSGLTKDVHTCLEAAMDLVELDDWETLMASASMLTFVHSGYAAEYGGDDEFGRWYEQRLWSHAWELDHAYYSGPYALFSDKYDRANGHMNRVGVAVHEIAQALGAPARIGDYPGYGLGYYDMLSNPWGFDGTLTHCGSMSPYTKYLLGWIDLEVIDQDGTYELEQSYSSSKIYKITRGFPDGEYLLIENRQEEGYDKGLSQPGLAIFHIDEKANNIAASPESGNFPTNHYIVSLLQSDGRFDLERMEDEGDTGDLFHAGRWKSIGPNGATHRDGSTTTNGHPNTNSYQSGVEVSTGITIDNISTSAEVMSFDIIFAAR